MRKIVESMPNVLVRLIRFGLTGGVTTGVHFMTVVVLVEFFAVHPVLANVIAFFVATVFSLVVNTLWSFGSRFTGQNVFRYWVVACLALVATIAASSLAEFLGLHYLIGVLFVVLVVPPTTFVGHNFWTFREEPSAGPS